MVASKMEVITSEEELNNIFDHKEDATGIVPSFPMPKIGGKAKTVMIMPSIGKDGSLSPVFKATHPNLNNGKPVIGMLVEEIGNEGTIYKINLGKSLMRNFDALCNDNHIKFMDLVGKIINISASPFKGNESKNMCGKPGCKGIGNGGCSECGGTGYSTVFAIALRRDLMSPSKASKRNDQF